VNPPTPPGESVIFEQLYKFAAATKTGRVRVVGSKETATGFYFQVYYTRDHTAGTPTWVQVGSFSSATKSEMLGTTLAAVDMSKFGIKVRSQCNPGCATGKLAKAFAVDFLEAPSGAQAVVGNNYGLVQGDSSAAYGNLRHQFPGASGSGGSVVFTAGFVGHSKIRIKKANSGDTLDSDHPLVVRVYDTISGNSWTLLSIAATSITSSWVEWADLFDTGANEMGGDLWIEVRTLNSKPILVDKLHVAAGTMLNDFSTSAQERAVGLFADWRESGPARAYPKGAWSIGTPISSTVT
jgi:hypothetical protein